MRYSRSTVTTKVMEKEIVIISTLIMAISCQSLENISTASFPEDLLLGVGSSAYQSEGAWNEGGKGLNEWDVITHNFPQMIADGSNGDIAADSYHKYKEDIDLLKELGVSCYRFSLSWSRILPSGFNNKINQFAIDYYNDIINRLVAYNITPIVTIFDGVFPISIVQLGGFANGNIFDWFEDYVRVVFEKFGDRVKLWVTINNPKRMCVQNLKSNGNITSAEAAGVVDYLCAHNAIKSHARSYHVYNITFRETQKGKVGIALDCPWYEPASNSSADVQAADRAMQFQCGWFAHPLFHKEGDYPNVMKEFVSQRSKEEGFVASRLPEFTTDNINYITFSFDFFGLNHFASYLTSDAVADPIGEPSYKKDVRLNISFDLNWYNTSLPEIKVYPMGFRKVLNWIKDNYDDPEIYVLENGFAAGGTLNDTRRIQFHSYELSNMLEAMYTDKVKIKGYVAWSFLDQFEFYKGHTINFGLYHVNYSDPNRPRVAKNSAKFYSELIKGRRIPTNSLSNT